MDEVGRLIVLMAIAGGAFTALGAAFLWFLDEGRRVRRSLKKVLGGEPHALLVARGTGKGVGFDFAANAVVVTWDQGGWCLKYRIEELMGAELIVDGQVTARTHRGEARRALDNLSGAKEHVRLRFVFDDLTYPDFALDLWRAASVAAKKGLSSAEALQEGARWIARMESLLRRPVPRRGTTMAAEPRRPGPPLAAPDAGADEDDDEGTAENAP